MVRLFLFVLLSFSTLPGISQITFHKNYGQTSGLGLSAKQTSDGGYIVTGRGNMGASFSNDNLFLLKLDMYGDTLWSQVYADMQVDEGWSVYETPDKGFIVGGHTGNWMEENYYLLKTDSVGNILWDKRYGENLSNNEDICRGLIPTYDGGYLLSGWKYGIGGGCYLVKTDSMGDSLWSKFYEGIKANYGVPAVQTLDGGYVVAGKATFGLGLFKTDATGNILWKRSYSNSFPSLAGVALDGPTADGGFILAAMTGDYNNDDFGIYLIKTDSAGNIIWEKYIGGSGVGGSWAYDVIESADGGYVICGFTDAYGAGQNDAFLIKTNASGTIEWSNTYGGPEADYAYSVEQVSDGGYVMSGHSGSFWLAGVSVIKTDALGNSGCNQMPVNFIATPITSTVGSPTITVGPGLRTLSVSTDRENIVIGSCDECNAVAVVIDSIIPITCGGYDDGEIYITVSGGTPPYTYSWTSGDSTEDVTGLSDGGLTLWLTDSTNCRRAFSFNMSFAPSIAPNVTTTDVTCTGDSNGTATSTPYNGSPPYTYSWNDPMAQTDSIATGLSVGGYTVTVSDTNGCYQSQWIYIGQTPPIDADMLVYNVTCAGFNDGVGMASPVNGIPPYTYLWDDSLNQTTSTASNLSPGSYHLTIYDSTGCSGYDSLVITEPSQLMLDSAWVNAVCDNASDAEAGVSISGGIPPYTYLWSTGDTSAALNNLGPGLYTVVISDTNGCSISDSMIVINYTGPTLNATSSGGTCNGCPTGSIDVTVAGGALPYDFVWSTGDSTEDLSNISGGDYSITVTDSNGCSTEASMVVSEPPFAGVLRPNLLSTSSFLSLVICDSSYVWSCGENANGQLGHGGEVDTNLLTPIMSISNIIATDAGSASCLALEDNGNVWAWGRNNNGQLGDGTYDQRNSPIPVPSMVGIYSISTSSYFSAASKNDGTVWAWGSNSDNQLGDTTLIESLVPVQVQGVNNVKKVSAGSWHCLALRTDSTVWGWGYSFLTGTSSGKTPEKVSGLKKVIDIEASDSHSAAIKSDGTLWMWGENVAGDLGIDTALSWYEPLPVQVAGLSNIVDVSLGYQFTAALNQAGEVYCWGWNGSGQLGNGTYTEMYIPQKVSGLPDIIEIATESQHIIALDVNGDVWGWGMNIYGQLGVGFGSLANIDEPLPLQMILDCVLPDITGTRIVDHADTYFNIYPNPATGMLFVDLKGVEEGIELYILNTLGQVIVTASILDKKIVELNVADLRSGIYVVEIRCASGTLLKKFSKL